MSLGHFAAGLRIAHVNLSVDDVDAARSFYGELLGLEPAARPADAGRPGCWFRDGDVELHLSLDPGVDNRTSRRHVAFEVEDLGALRARFTGAGIATEDGRHMPGVVRFFVRDPAGNRLEFYQPGGQPAPAQASRAAVGGGRMLVHELGPAALARMAHADLATLTAPPESPIGDFSFHGCTCGVGCFTGQPPWERHGGGDELLLVLEGETELTVLWPEGPSSIRLTPGNLALAPQGRWHRNHARTGVTLLYMTPRDGNDHSWEDPTV